jgi:hypothetical protein
LLDTGNHALFSGRTDDNNRTTIYLSNNQINLQNMTASPSGTTATTSAVFRDPSAWYHIVVIYDSANGTSANRFIVYVNGVLQAMTGTYPSLNDNSGINSTGAHAIGRIEYSSPTGYYDGYMAEVNFIDGQALTPSSFGAYDATTGVWQPALYTGTYGTNGFYLKFASFGTTAALGTDSSGNGNTWTVNNISVTAGVTYDPMLDSPTLTSATVANFPTLNPLCLLAYSTGTGTISNGNLTHTAASGSTYSFGSMKFPSGLWYWEVTATTINAAGYPVIGVQAFINNSGGAAGNGQYSYGQDGYYYFNGSNSSGHGTFTTGDVIMIAYNATNGKLWFGKNGTWNASGDPAAGTNPAMTITVGLADNYSFTTNYVSSVTNHNFGQRAFSYTPPTGFVALNAYNLATPTIANGATVMAATTWTGNGTTPRTFTNGGDNTLGVTFKPDLVWAKPRNAATNNVLYDSVRGSGSGKALSSNLTDAEGLVASGNSDALYGYLSAFNSNGFSATTGSSGFQYFNTNTTTEVAWQWLAGAGSSSSNTNGSITSTVSVNATAGFSVVTYTGTGGVATVGHGLGVAPSMIVVKSRSAVQNWYVYHISVGNTGGLNLNLSSATVTTSNLWNNTSPTSSVFTVSDNGAGWTNPNTQSMVAYCWSAVAGYSAFGSYTSNGNVDGPFIYLGFRPRWIMTKCVGAADSWVIYDTSRNTYNVETSYLLADTAGAEGTAIQYDILSNGFKFRTATSQNQNAYSTSFIYAAFAENPFKYALAR